MNALILLLIFIAALLNKCNVKRILYGAFAVLMALHYAISDFIPDDHFAFYYLSGSVLLVSLADIFPYDKKHAVFHVVIIACMLANLTGYMLWFSYLSHEIYNLICLGLYSFVLAILINGQAYGMANRFALSLHDRVCSLLNKNSRHCMDKVR